MLHSTTQYDTVKLYKVFKIVAASGISRNASTAIQWF